MRNLIVCLLGIMYFVSPDPAWAARIFCASKIIECKVGVLSGEIESGDFERFKDFVIKNSPVLESILLVSPGGSVREALAIGRLMRKYLLSTGSLLSISNDDWDNPEDVKRRCASACALIWLGGVDRSETVGFHRPAITGNEYKNLPPSDASRIYIQILAEIKIYMDEMEAPPSLIEKMVATPSNDIYWVDAERDNLIWSPSIHAWVDATCKRDVRDAQFNEKPMGSVEHILLQRLGEERFQWDRCMSSLIKTHKRKISFP